MDFLRGLGERHEQLKKRIHSTRIPLSKNGRTLMGVVYFTAPVVCGYFIMNWATGRAEQNFAREEDEIRHATDAKTNAQIQQQNKQLKVMIQDATK